MIFTKGNIIDEFKTGKYDFLLHQANCRGVMGAGVAGALVSEWPWLEKVDSQFHENFPMKKYGSYSIFGTNFGEIVNIYGQFEPGSPLDATVDSFEKRCFHLKKALGKFASEHSGKILMPLMASGIAANNRLKLGMSDKEYFVRFIMPIVEEALPGWDITVITL